MKNSIIAKSNVPLYKQLYGVLLDKIEEGTYQPGDKIPSEDSLSETYNISRVTVRGAIQYLVDAGILVRIHGKGTYVVESLAANKFFPGGSFTKVCKHMNLVATTEILASCIEPAERKIAVRLNVGEGQDVIRIHRLRKINDKACIFEMDFFTLEHRYLLEEDLLDKSLLTIINDRGLYSSLRFEDFFDVLSPSSEIASHLDCEPETYLLRVSQTVFTELDKILYYNEQFIRTDRYRYAVRSFSN